MNLKTIQTGTTLVSSAVPDRSTHKNSLADPEEFKQMMKTIRVEGFNPRYFSNR